MKFLQQLHGPDEPKRPSILADLTESSVIRDRLQARRYTAREICDYVFVHMLALYIMADEFDFIAKAMGHAKRTVLWGHFKEFRTGSTDLYMYLHLITTNSGRDLLGDQINSKAFFRSFNLDMRDLTYRLRMLSQGRRYKTAEFRFLQQLEKQLKVSDSTLRSCRRLVSDWDSITTRNKRLVLTRLLQVLRPRAPHSDMMTHLEALGRFYNLELKYPELQVQGQPKSTVDKIKHNALGLIKKGEEKHSRPAMIRAKKELK